jgi:hypothetical protein
VKRTLGLGSAAMGVASVAVLGYLAGRSPGSIFLACNSPLGKPAVTRSVSRRKFWCADLAALTFAASQANSKQVR